jgi:glucose/arabinose dehydrogenase
MPTGLAHAILARSTPPERREREDIVMAPIRTLGLAAACVGLASAAVAQPQEEPAPAFPGQTDAPAPATSSAYETTTVYTGLSGPWALAFLPDGDMLITQTRGQMYILDPDTGFLNGPLHGAPDVKVIGSQAMHDVVLDPDFENNRLIYFTYFRPPEGEGPAVWPLEYLYDRIWAMTLEERRAVDLGMEVMARARLSDDKRSLENVEVLVEGGDRRINFGPDGLIYVSGADRFRFYDSDLDSYGKAELPLNDRRNYAGGVFRIRPDGSIPDDNPFVGVQGANPAVFAFGNKDPEGAAFNPETGELWQVEHGPQGGDEINIIRAGRDYGWPIISYGVQYERDGYAPVGSGLTAMEGMEQPIYYWVPSIAPSGMMFYTGDLFPEWKGDLFVGAMRAGTGRFLVRLELEGDRVIEEEHLLVELDQRIRDIRQGPDGAVYVIAGDSIVKLTPKAE